MVATDILVNNIGAILGLLGIIISIYARRSTTKVREELNYRFTLSSKLYDERGEVISEIYKRLVAFNRAMKRLTDPHHTPDNQVEDAQSEAKALILYYRDHEIYLDEHVCNLMNEIIEEQENIFTRYNIASESEDFSIPADERTEHWETMNSTVTDLRQELKQEFRYYLAVENSHTSVSQRLRQWASREEETDEEGPDSESVDSETSSL